MSVLVIVLFLVVLQVGVALHVRNVLIASAADGARYAANADRGSADGEWRTREAVASALGRQVADRMAYTVREVTGPDGLLIIEVRVQGPLPVVLLPVLPVTLTARGHALEEGR